jgi:glutathione synthase/RimK-type ligase-like ATP-grasp enzyme
MIAIHKTGSFAKRWIEYCKANDINYKVVNAYDNDIILQIKNCDALMWHHDHGKYKDVLTAKKILFALEHAGIKVFPDFNTGWHFDDKVAQKYLLEAIDAPLVPSYVFYDKTEAINWAKNTSYPKVFKLKGGAGASNVKLVKNQSQALKLINKAFSKGFSQFDSWQNLKDRYEKYKRGKDTLIGLVKGVGRLFINTDYAKQQSKEKGYIYFQEFIANNDSDTRVVIVGNYAVAEKRFVRKGDFRASGSGEFSYVNINLKAIGLAFEISKKLKLQCVAFDFVEDDNSNPLIVEISYGFGTAGINKAPGYWDSGLNWHEGKFNPQEWMVEDLVNSLNE